jgi:uncharacterized phage protein (TIGR01671 family)
MREIKFRAFDNVTNIMWTAPEQLYFENATLTEVIFQTSWCCGDENVDWAKIENVTLMQFIGKKDLNNVEIYEGDIVRGDDALSRDDPAHNAGYWPTGIVIYKNAGFIIQSEDTDWARAFHVPIDWSKVEVIGNKFENKDLI